MKNILTVDVEEWFDVTGFSGYIRDKSGYKSLIEKQTVYLMDILDEYKAKATFFILGAIVESFPDLVREIIRRGHEAAIHGFTHRLAASLSVEELKGEIKRSKSALEFVIGARKVAGYRAPSWSINNNTKWVLNFLEDDDFLYDSSLFPGRVRHGFDGLLAKPHIPRGVNHLWEIPPSVLGPFNIPFSGGFFLRLFPYWFIKFSVKQVNRNNQPAIVYIHPWELDVSHPRLKAPFKDRFIHYLNLDTAENKLRSLLKDFKFTTISEWLSDNNPGGPV